MLTTKELQTKIDEYLLYAVVIEFQLFGTVWAMMNVSGKPYLLLYWGFVALALVKICIQKNTWKEWIFILVFGILAVMSWQGSEDKTPLLLMLGVCISKNVNLEKLLKIDFVFRVISTLLLIILPAAGLYENMMIQERGITRMYFGWQAANGMGFSFFLICLEWMCFRHKKFQWFDYVGILVMIVFLDRTANSRTAELLMLAILVVEIAVQIKDKWFPGLEEYRIWTLGCITGLCMDIATFAISLYFYLVRQDIWSSLSSTFTSRFHTPGAFLAAHGWTLFGSPYNPEIYDYLDIAFAYLTLHLGIVMAVIVLFLMIRTIIYGYRNRDEKLLLLFMFVCVRSMTESEHFTLMYAFFPIILGLSVWQTKRGRLEYVRK